MLRTIRVLRTPMQTGGAGPEDWPWLGKIPHFGRAMPCPAIQPSAHDGHPSRQGGYRKGGKCHGAALEGRPGVTTILIRVGHEVRSGPTRDRKIRRSAAELVGAGSKSGNRFSEGVAAQLCSKSCHLTLSTRSPSADGFRVASAQGCPW